MKLILRGKRKTFRFGGAVTVQQRVGPRGSIVRQEAARRRVVVLFVVIGLGTVAKSSSPEEESKEEEEEARERERERERDFNLHEAAVSSSGNYSAGLATREPRRGRHVRGEDLLVEEEEEKKRANNAAGLRLRERKQPT